MKKKNVRLYSNKGITFVLYYGRLKTGKIGHALILVPRPPLITKISAGVLLRVHMF